MAVRPPDPDETRREPAPGAARLRPRSAVAAVPPIVALAPPTMGARPLTEPARPLAVAPRLTEAGEPSSATTAMRAPGRGRVRQAVRAAMRDRDDHVLLDPAGMRIRLVRDAAAALCLIAAAVLVGSTLAPRAPTGAVLSATGIPGGAAGAPDGGPGRRAAPATGVPADDVPRPRAAPAAGAPSGAGEPQAMPTPSPTQSPSPDAGTTAGGGSTP